MYELRLATKDGKVFTPFLFDSIEDAVRAFRQNVELGLCCELRYKSQK